jgi:hypothetical protein
MWQSSKVANSPRKPLVFRVFSRFPLCQAARCFGKVANRVGADSCDRPAERCDAAFPQIGNGEPMKIVDLRRTG